jgi:hypothetical protein
MGGTESDHKLKDGKKGKISLIGSGMEMTME